MTDHSEAKHIVNDAKKKMRRGRARVEVREAVKSNERWGGGRTEVGNEGKMVAQMAHVVALNVFGLKAVFACVTGLSSSPGRNLEL